MPRTIVSVVVLGSACLFLACDITGGTALDTFPPAASSNPVPAPPVPPLFWISFDHADGSLFTQATAAADFGYPVSYYQGGVDRLQTWDHALRFEYPAGMTVHDSGGEIRLELPPASTFRLEYQVRFDPGFDFAKGGKLPGLAGGTATSGGTKCTGDGWSAKLMWREQGALKLYLYHLDMPDSFGQYFDLGVSAVRGEWITISQSIRMNSADNHDGSADILINGASRLHLDGLQFMTEACNPRIDRLLFYSFFGGSDASWAPAWTSWAYFDNVAVWKQ